MRERELAFPFRRYQIQRVWRGETPQAQQGPLPRVLPVRHRHHRPRQALATWPRPRSRASSTACSGRWRSASSASASTTARCCSGLLQELRRGRRQGARRCCACWTRPKRKTRRGSAPTSSARACRPRRRASTSSSRRAERPERRLSCPRRNHATNCRAGPARSCAASSGDPPVRRARYRLRGGPRRRARPGLLHRHDLRDHARRITPSSAASAPAGATTTWRATSPIRKLPGVGISIGLTRLFSQAEGGGAAAGRCRARPAEVLVTTMDARYLERYLAMARRLREAGINTEVYLEPAKLGNQLAYADQQGIPRRADRRRERVREGRGAGQEPRARRPRATCSSANWCRRCRPH